MNMNEEAERLTEGLLRHIDDKSRKDGHALRLIKATKNEVTGKWTGMPTLEESLAEQRSEETRRRGRKWFPLFGRGEPHLLPSFLPSFLAIWHQNWGLRRSMRRAVSTFYADCRPSPPLHTQLLWRMRKCRVHFPHCNKQMLLTPYPVESITFLKKIPEQ